MIINKDAVVFTGGIGDVLTIDSYLTQEERARINRIYWATKTQKFTKQLLKAANKFYPNLKKHITAWDQFDLFHSLGTASSLHKLRKPPGGYDKAQDLSISKIFREIIKLKTPFRGSCLLKTKIADIKKFSLPKEYICICPWTNNYSEARNFSVEEWYSVLKWLKHTGQVAVIVGTPETQLPFQVKWATSLIGKTTISEVVEVLKNAYGYIGVDTWLSVLAAQLFEKNRLMIKSNNSHLYVYKSIYYAPHETFDFITKQILPMNPDPVLASYPNTAIGENLQWAYLHDVYYQKEITNLVPYDENYFNKYVSYEKNSISRNLLKFRSGLVKKYCKKNSVLDIGIGSGAFIRYHDSKVFGFDICEPAVEWLKKKCLYTNPWMETKPEINGYCFWDSFEHIVQPSIILSSLSAGTYVFISMPIISNDSQIGNLEELALWMYQWKHFRPNEHVHYWTAGGLKKYMKSLGFSLIVQSDKEVKIGRQDIGTFVFMKE